MTAFDAHCFKGGNTLVLGPGIAKEDLSSALAGQTLAITLRENGQGGGSHGDTMTLTNFNRFNEQGGSVVTQQVRFEQDGRPFMHQCPSSRQARQAH